MCFATKGVAWVILIALGGAQLQLTSLIWILKKPQFCEHSNYQEHLGFDQQQQTQISNYRFTIRRQLAHQVFIINLDFMIQCLTRDDHHGLMLIWKTAVSLLQRTSTSSHDKYLRSEVQFSHCKECFITIIISVKKLSLLLFCEWTI